MNFNKGNITRTINTNYPYDFYLNDYRAIKIIRHKSLTNYLLNRACVPVPKQQLFTGKEYARIFAFIEKIGYPVCIKPDISCEGKDVFPQICNEEEVIEVVEYLAKRTVHFVIEEFIQTLIRPTPSSRLLREWHHEARGPFIPSRNFAR